MRTTVHDAERVLLKDRQRVEEIIHVLIHYGYAGWVERSAPAHFHQMFVGLADAAVVELTDGQRLCQACLDLGPTFEKLGQIMSTRPDLVGPDIADALSTLQAGTTPDDAETVRATVESELAKPLEEAFRSFDLEAMASASIGQVHAAVLKDGSPVVVKVQHARADDLMRRDLAIIEALAALAEARDERLAVYRPRAMAAQLRRSLLAELDFTREGTNLSRFRHNFAGESDVVIPKPYPELSSHKVLTMERLDGVKLTDAIGELGERAHDLAIRGAEIYLEMIFRDRLFHADPHPGNLLLVGSDKIGLLDFGSVGHLDDDMEDVLQEFFLASMSRNLDDTVDALLRLCDAPVTLDMRALRSALGEWIQSYLPGGGDEHIDMQGAMSELMAVCRDHQLRMPTDIALLSRVLIELQGLLVRSGAHIDLSDALRPYASEIVKQRFSPRRLARHAQRTARDWERLFEAAPRDVTAILEGIRRGEIEVPLELRTLDRNVNRVLVGVLAAALFSGSSRMWADRVPPLVRGVSLPGAAGLGAAAVLAARVLRSVKAHGGV